MFKRQALQKFLHSQPYDLCKLYTPEMEIQVNVARDEGEPVHGIYAGKRWHGFQDGMQLWKSFRIPWNANSIPSYADREIKFDISQHAEAIGMTGWDWSALRSRWVGFDFDSLVGHKEGLTDDELREIKDKLLQLDYANCYTSTSGLGLHIYIHLDLSINIPTHTHHAAVARSLLNKISAATGIELEAKVDCMGGNMWVWHRRAVYPISFKCIKTGTVLNEIPANWQDYMHQVSKGTVVRTDKNQKLDDIIAAKSKLNLEEDHLRLLEWFERKGGLWWWDDVKQMLVCHTSDLRRAHTDLSLVGFFNTLATGKDRGHDQNCFCFPIRRGGWIIRRHTRGVLEHISWHVDRSGWTTTYYNQLPNLRTASKLMGGVEGEKDHQFDSLDIALRTMLSMGITIERICLKGYTKRRAYIQELRDSRIKISFDKLNEKEEVPEWSVSKNKKTWDRLFFRPKIADETELPDNLLRHVTVNDVEQGWFLHTNNLWIGENRANIYTALVSLGHKKPEVDQLMGQCVLWNWKQVALPFQAEYPGNRRWNKNAPQLKYRPEDGDHPTWDLIFQHCGAGLDDSLKQNRWAHDSGILTGQLYLQAWCGAMLQYPNSPSPYLFFCGPQNCGKSIFHEVLSELFTKGYCRADQALTNQSGFNGELGTSVLCIIEETNLSKRGFASDRIKDWVTGQTILIHNKGKTPYEISNHTHWVQCANDNEYCPIFPGDTRITLITVRLPDSDISKPLLIQRCQQEAAAFTYTLLNFELPSQEGRLRIPVINTEEKLDIMDFNKSQLERFMETECHAVPGSKILFKEFHSKFHEWMDPNDREMWTNRKVASKIPYPRGKYGGRGDIYVGNVSFDTASPPSALFKRENGRLVRSI